MAFHGTVCPYRKQFLRSLWENREEWFDFWKEVKTSMPIIDASAQPKLVNVQSLTNDGYFCLIIKGQASLKNIQTITLSSIRKEVKIEN